MLGKSSSYPKYIPRTTIQACTRAAADSQLPRRHYQRYTTTKISYFVRDEHYFFAFFINYPVSGKSICPINGPNHSAERTAGRPKIQTHTDAVRSRRTLQPESTCKWSLSALWARTKTLCQTKSSVRLLIYLSNALLLSIVLQAAPQCRAA